MRICILFTFFDTRKLLFLIFRYYIRVYNTPLNSRFYYFYCTDIHFREMNNFRSLENTEKIS